MNALQQADIRNGNALAPGEALLWRGRPSWSRIARDVLHVRGVAAYFVLLFLLDAFQAWAKAIPVDKALHDSVPLALIAALALGILTAFAWLIGRTTRYIVTDRRVILHYGMAMPATLAIPMSQIVGSAVAANADHTADILLQLTPGTRMPYLKLWPHARPWRLANPQPMLRGVPHGSGVAALLVRTLQAAERRRADALYTPEPPLRELLSA